MLTEIFIVLMYLGTMMGMVLFLAFVCRVGDLGFYLLGWIDSVLQDRHMRRLAKRPAQISDAVESDQICRVL
jgi:hypothetical protein